MRFALISLTKTHCLITSLKNKSDGSRDKLTTHNSRDSDKLKLSSDDEIEP